MSIKLPLSLDRTRHSVNDEVAFSRTLSVEQRVQVVALVCLAAHKSLALNSKRERLLTLRDPMPPSTIAALQRLRSQR